MRLLVVGAGATGGYFGGRLAQAGRDVTFLVRPSRAAQLHADGLRIVSAHHGDATIAPKLAAAETIDGPYDVVLVTVKAYALEAAVADFAPAVAPATIVLPVLNGMRHLETLSARFGEGAVVGGVCRVATMLEPDGRIVQIAPFQELAYGERDGAVSARMQALDSFLRGAGFDATLSPAVIAEMWAKWTLLAAMGALNCLLRGNVGEIAAAPGGTDVAHAILAEVVGIVTAVGTRPRDGVIDTCRTMLTARGSAQASSMYRDLLKGYPVEADHILGDLLSRGRRAGITSPLLTAAYANLCVYQARRSAA